jgi:hypothetical protein
MGNAGEKEKRNEKGELERTIRGGKCEWGKR